MNAIKTALAGASVITQIVGLLSIGFMVFDLALPPALRRGDRLLNLGMLVAIAWRALVEASSLFSGYSTSLSGSGSFSRDSMRRSRNRNRKPNAAHDVVRTDAAAVTFRDEAGDV